MDNSFIEITPEYSRWMARVKNAMAIVENKKFGWDDIYPILMKARQKEKLPDKLVAQLDAWVLKANQIDAEILKGSQNLNPPEVEPEDVPEWAREAANPMVFTPSQPARKEMRWKAARQLDPKFIIWMAEVKKALQWSGDIAEYPEFETIARKAGSKEALPKDLVDNYDGLITWMRAVESQK